MSSYRPNYGNQYAYIPPPPPAHFMPPLPPGPPPTYDPYRVADSYRPPQSDFAFRNSNSVPRFPSEQDHLRPTRSREYARQENGGPPMRNHHKDNTNLNQARRGNNYKPRQNQRTAPANRPLLRHHDEGKSSEQMLGMANSQKFLAADDISDSDEEQMDESDSDQGQGKSDGMLPVAESIGHGGVSAVEDSMEPPSKRRALTTKSDTVQDKASEPKWSNPDPYTVLPPVDEASRKKKDVVKLIRKARKETEGMSTEHNQVAANDDFISFGMEDDEDISPANAHGRDGSGGGVPGPPTGPREFSHLHNLHGQKAPGASEAPINTASADNAGPEGRHAHTVPKVPEEVVLDVGRSNIQNTSSYCGDENLGNRKRTYDDSIKGRRKTITHNNGSILHEWKPTPGMDPIPWLQRTDMITANAGFRLHKEICDFYDFVQPKDFEQNVRQELLARLQTTIDQHIPNTTVLCFGSFAAGLYLPNADMDVVIVSNSFRSLGQKVVCQAPNQMRRFAKYLEDSGFTRTRCEVITGAKVPIIKFVERLTGIKVDVSFENDTGIIANDTFASWKRQYPAMPILVTIIKQFLMMRGLNEVQHGGLGGFSVTCLVTSLLQNMPRVQSGDVIPEEHLGEMLLEFLDFYGNRLDTARTGIMMRPPGYFEKSFDRSNFQGPTYQANKADRLAIMDPNRPENDISGGSREVMLIFDRFALAHQEILQAIKRPGRVSLLDWLLGGNYESFASQRNHLLELYRKKWGSPAVIPAQNQPLGERDLGNERSSGLRGGGIFHSEDPYTSLPHQPASNFPKTAPDPLIAETNIQRAADLKAKYPDMQGIPVKVGRKKALQLIIRHEAKNKKSTKKITAQPAQPAQLTKEELARLSQKQRELAKNQDRARGLKKQYPDMKGIPNAISKKHRLSMIAAYETQKNVVERGTAQRKSVRQAELPQRPLPPPPEYQQSRYPTRLYAANHEKDQKLLNLEIIPQRRPISNKMVPLSDERRAEVARNLSTGSNSDPITLD